MKRATPFERPLLPGLKKLCLQLLGAAVILPLLGLCTGCFILYAPMAAPPGRYVPPMQKGQGDFAVDVVLGRNVAYGVSVGDGGAPEPDSTQTPLWPGIDLAFRYGLTDKVGLDARITSSLILPLPFPAPNGLTLAPIFTLLDDAARGVALHISPRALWIGGTYLTAVLDHSRKIRIRSLGAELPVIFTYTPAPWFDLSGTAFIRAFYNFGRLEDISTSNTLNATAGWPALGGGLSLAAIFTAGRFRASFGLGLEVGPNFATGYGESAGQTSADGAVVFYPQGGISLGTAWD